MLPLVMGLAPWFLSLFLEVMPPEGAQEYERLPNMLICSYSKTSSRSSGPGKGDQMLLT